MLYLKVPWAIKHASNYTLDKTLHIEKFQCDYNGGIKLLIFKLTGNILVNLYQKYS